MCVCACMCVYVCVCVLYNILSVSLPYHIVTMLLKIFIIIQLTLQYYTLPIHGKFEIILICLLY